jgi:hypothetical protein
MIMFLEMDLIRLEGIDFYKLIFTLDPGNELQNNSDFNRISRFFRVYKDYEGLKMV